MAVAEIIGAVIGVMLLLIVAYMLVGSVLTTAEVVTTAQKDITLLNEVRMRTSINLDSISCSDINPTNCTISVINNGNEIISDFNHMDILTGTGSGTDGFQYIYYNTTLCGNENIWCTLTIVPDTIHPNELDPNETMWMRATVPGNKPTWFQVTTGNGVYAQRTQP